MTAISTPHPAVDSNDQNASPAVERHPVWKSVILHLLPGLLVLGAFTLLARPVEAMGFPSSMPWLMAVLLVIIPFELGYLLPRLAYLGGWAVLLNSFLFALYHFTTPWVLVTRVLTILPLAYVAYRKQNLIPSILVHVVANSVDVDRGSPIF